MGEGQQFTLASLLPDLAKGCTVVLSFGGSGPRATALLLSVEGDVAELAWGDGSRGEAHCSELRVKGFWLDGGDPHKRVLEVEPI